MHYTIKLFNFFSDLGNTNIENSYPFKDQAP